VHFLIKAEMIFQSLLILGDATGIPSHLNLDYNAFQKYVPSRSLVSNLILSIAGISRSPFAIFLVTDSSRTQTL
jgi:hypothetical protein